MRHEALGRRGGAQTLSIETMKLTGLVDFAWELNSLEN